MRLAGALLALAWVAAPAPGRAQGPRIAVVPFAPLSGEVPLGAGEKAAALLAAELGHLGGLEAFALPLEPDAAARRSLAEAREAVNEARALRSRRDPQAAAVALRRALASFGAAAPLLDDARELSDAHAALAAALYLCAQDEAGERELGRALSLTPRRALTDEATSPLFAAEVQRVRESLRSRAGASLRLDSTPSRARVELDGIELGRTPLEVRGVPEGEHLYRVLLPTRGPQGGVLQVVAGVPLRRAAALGGSAPLERLVAALAQGRLDEASLAAAREVAGAARADFLVLGGLSPQDPDLALGTFLLLPGPGEAVRLPVRRFDAELLSAGTALFDVAGEVGARLERRGEPEALPAPLLLGVAPPPEAAPLEVDYAEATERGGPPPPARGPRRPIDPSQVRELRPREK